MSFGKRKTSPLKTILKWFAGIVLLSVFVITTGIYNLYLITSPEIAIPTLGRIMETTATAIDMGNIERLREDVLTRGMIKMELKPGITVNLNREKVQDIPSREFGSYLFREAAAPLYSEGLRQLPASARDGEARRGIGSLESSMRYLARDFHDSTRVLLIITGITSLLLFAALFFLSYRFGKLVSAGIVLLLTGAIGTALITILKSATSYIAACIPGTGWLGDKLSGSMSNVTAPLTSLVTTTYFILLLAGGALLVMAFFGKWIYNIVTGKDEGED